MTEEEKLKAQLKERAEARERFLKNCIDELRVKNVELFEKNNVLDEALHKAGKL